MMRKWAHTFHPKPTVQNYTMPSPRPLISSITKKPVLPKCHLRSRSLSLLPSPHHANKKAHRPASCIRPIHP